MPGDVRRSKRGLLENVLVRVEEIAQHGEQVLAYAADHLLADERDVGRVLELEPDSAFVLDHGDLECLVAAQDLSDVIVRRARVQHRERALPPQLVEPTLARVAQLARFDSGEDLQAAFRGDKRIHDFEARFGG